MCSVSEDAIINTEVAAIIFSDSDSGFVLKCLNPDPASKFFFISRNRIVFKHGKPSNVRLLCNQN